MLGAVALTPVAADHAIGIILVTGKLKITLKATSVVPKNVQMNGIRTGPIGQRVLRRAVQTVS